MSCFFFKSFTENDTNWDQHVSISLVSVQCFIQNLPFLLEVNKISIAKSIGILNLVFIQWYYIILEFRLKLQNSDDDKYTQSSIVDFNVFSRIT